MKFKLTDQFSNILKGGGNEHLRWSILFNFFFLLLVISSFS